MAEISEPAPAATPSKIITRDEFAAVLTALRTRAGFSVRGLAQALETPTATIGDYCSGRHLPGPAQQDLFSAMLRLLGIEEDQLGAWLELVGRLRAGTDARVRRIAATPYQGLAPFGVDDRERFFGREAVSDEILQRLTAQSSGMAEPSLVLVVGPSGAGKSSLLRAGIQARIQQGALGNLDRDWTASVFNPGEMPLEALRSGLAELPRDGRVLIVDQLEEVFAAPAAVQDVFFDELGLLPAPGTLVLAGLRADFYEQASRVPVLLAALRAAPVLLGPMSAEELRTVITGPARYAGAQVDDGLVELLIADLAPRDAAGFAHDAGSLPLLSHALLQCWERARLNRLTIADYRASGGLRGAVRQTAEEVYTHLDVEGRELARRLFMRLVRVPQDGPPVRRRASRHELDALDGGDDLLRHARVDEVTQEFVAARLITADTDAIELESRSALERMAPLGEMDRGQPRRAPSPPPAHGRHERLDRGWPRSGAASAWRAAPADRGVGEPAGEPSRAEH